MIICFILKRHTYNYIVALWIMMSVTFFFASCSGEGDKGVIDSELVFGKPLREFSFKYVRDIKIREYSSYKTIDVGCNSNNSIDNTITYILVNRDSLSTAKSLQGLDKKRFRIIETPLRKVACLESTDIVIFEMLGALSKVVAIAEPKYVGVESLVKTSEKGDEYEVIAGVEDLGLAIAPNIERLMLSRAEVLFLSPYSKELISKIEKMGVSVVENCSYLEESPLARSEWIRFMGLFLNKERECDSIFEFIEKEYLRVIEIAKQGVVKGDRKSIISEKIWGDSWGVPAGKSYMATLFRDASLDYPWSDDTLKGSLMLSFERVYEKGEKADFWVFKSSSNSESYDNLLKENHKYGYFKAYKERNILFCNTQKTYYFQKGAFEPHIILSDIVKLIYPHLLQGYTPKYFKRLE